MKVSVITVVYNAQETIGDCIKSVMSQDYPDIEYIVVDGGSQDGTLDVIKKYSSCIDKFISEKDEGIYHAMAKGVDLASGDIVGILNADDFYSCSKIISDIVNIFKKDKVDSVYGDVEFIDNNNKVVRRYNSSLFKPERMKFGLMPAHPACFIKRDCYKAYGNYNSSFRIAGDFELLLRIFLGGGITYKYVERVFVKMRMGGVSTSGVKSTLKLNYEILRACSLNGIYSNVFMILLRYPLKISEFRKTKS